MAFMVPLLAAVTPGIATGISMAGTAFSAISASKQANYQAALLQQQALRDSYSSQVSAQDTGQQNMQEKANAVLSQSASGFSLASPAFAQRRAMLTALSARDQDRIVQDGQAKASVDIANANAAKQSAHDAILSGIFGIGKDLISGANLVAKQNIFDTNQQSQYDSSMGVY